MDVRNRTHPTYTPVCTYSRTGAFVFLLHRHPPAVAAVPVPVRPSLGSGGLMFVIQFIPLKHVRTTQHNTKQAWGPGQLLAYEAAPPADGGAGGRLVKARVHRLDAPESAATTGLHGCQTGGPGVLHPEAVLAGDLRPLTMGPGVPQVRTCHA